MFRFSRAASALLLNASLFRTARSFPAAAVSPNPNLTRANFLGNALLSTGISTHLKTASSPNNMDTSISLLESVYGPVEKPTFPLPMPAEEAGPCAGVDGQRRYLWTDAFGVLAYVSLAEDCDKRGETAEAEKYRRAADALVDVVHRCLGAPRSGEREHAMSPSGSSPTGYVGLRIGKVESMKVTDYGMRFDGQYWHYVDKWLLALARAGRVDDGIRIAKSCFPHFFDAGEDGTGVGGGIRWKLSVDASAPPSLHRSYANDDTLVALIVFSILESARPSEGETPSLAEEIRLLRNSLRGYRPRVTDDPLGWGLEAMYDQFLAGHPRRRALASLQSRALHPSHLSLPFRLYGAMIGARIAGDSVAPPDSVDKLVKLSIDHERRAAAAGFEEHSSINRVMLAMCLLCPGVLGRRTGDPLIALE